MSAIKSSVEKRVAKIKRQQNKNGGSLKVHYRVYSVDKTTQLL